MHCFHQWRLIQASTEEVIASKQQAAVESRNVRWKVMKVEPLDVKVKTDAELFNRSEVKNPRN